MPCLVDVHCPTCTLCYSISTLVSALSIASEYARGTGYRVVGDLDVWTCCRYCMCSVGRAIVFVVIVSISEIATSIIVHNLPRLNSTNYDIINTQGYKDNDIDILAIEQRKQIYEQAGIRDVAGRVR